MRLEVRWGRKRLRVGCSWRQEKERERLSGRRGEKEQGPRGEDRPMQGAGREEKQRVRGGGSFSVLPCKK